MIDDLINEYLAHAEAAEIVDYADEESVQQFNNRSNRMRTIADELVGLGGCAVVQFAGLLEKEPASLYAAIHLVERADLDSGTLSRCIARVEQAKEEDEIKSNFSDAIIKEYWLKKWKTKTAR